MSRQFMRLLPSIAVLCGCYGGAREDTAVPSSMVERGGATGEPKLEFTCDTDKTTAETFVKYAGRVEVPVSEFARIAQFESLQSINIYKAIVRDGSIRNLVGLSKVEMITFSESEISLKELSEFKNLKNLCRISFRGCVLPSGAAGVISSMPESMPKLNFIDITRTGLSREDVGRIRKLIPSMLIVDEFNAFESKAAIEMSKERRR